MNAAKKVKELIGGVVSRVVSDVPWHFQYGKMYWLLVAAVMLATVTIGLGILSKYKGALDALTHRSVITAIAVTALALCLVLATRRYTSRTSSIYSDMMHPGHYTKHPYIQVLVQTMTFGCSLTALATFVAYLRERSLGADYGNTASMLVFAVGIAATVLVAGCSMLLKRRRMKAFGVSGEQKNNEVRAYNAAGMKPLNSTRLGFGCALLTVTTIITSFVTACNNKQILNSSSATIGYNMAGIVLSMILSMIGLIAISLYMSTRCKNRETNACNKLLNVIAAGGTATTCFTMATSALMLGDSKSFTEIVNSSIGNLTVGEVIAIALLATIVVAAILGVAVGIHQDKTNNKPTEILSETDTRKAFNLGTEAVFGVGYREVECL